MARSPTDHRLDSEKRDEVEEVVELLEERGWDIDTVSSWSEMGGVGLQVSAGKTTDA